jgi:hypothetical protein
MATIDELFPNVSRVLLTGGGREFIERIGVDAARQVVLGVLKGENIRSQTEPLTRRRIAQVTGAMILLTARGIAEDSNFTENLPNLALDHMETYRRRGKAYLWPAQWLIGLTDKAVQNVLRGDRDIRRQYIKDFEQAVTEAAAQCQRDLGELSLKIEWQEKQLSMQRSADLDWKGIVLLTTAIGSATLTLRGSDKSMYGKLFERLVLGSVLTLLNFDQTDPLRPKRDNRVFWLSDSRDSRECDATVLLEPGRLLRFDIGFIGNGNPEITRDKLTRYANELERDGVLHTSRTFIVVDRLPTTGNTARIAEQVGVDLLQMSMQYWPRELAARIYHSTGYAHPLKDKSDAELGIYLEQSLAHIPIQNFLTGVSVEAMLSTDTPEE